MITLTLDKHTLIKADFSIRDSIHQGSGQSTPHRISRFGGFTPPEKAFSSRATPYSATGWDNASPEALYPCLSATLPRIVQVVGYPVHISPLVGRLSSQVMQSETEAAPRTIPSTSHVDAWEPRT
jgi:hypothetical protein